MREKIVITKYGKMSGEEKDGITIFKGVPYARAPIEELRWKEPKDPIPWQDVRICDRFGRIPFQPKGWVGEKALEENEQSEDCLYLNIWTAAEDRNSELPVFVWIHGGGFQGGCAHEELYDGMEFARKNIVVVSVSYRLGVFGFLAGKGFAEENEHHASGNYGLLDQIQALKWIQENITEFGGNPQNVTIVGQSAGGMSVACLMTSPLTEGLFHKAIIQSGGPRLVHYADIEEMDKQCRGLMERLQIEDYRELRQADAKTLTEMQMPPMPGGLPYQPIIDNYVLMESPYEAFLSGKVHQVPLIIGNTTDEGLFSPLSGTNKEGFEESIRVHFREMAEEFCSAYRVEEDWRAAADIAGKEFSFYNLQNLTEHMLQVYQASIYRYVFGQQAVTDDGIVLGAGHSSELFFVFSTLQCRENNKIPDGRTIRIQNSEQDQMLSSAMNGYWAAFVKTGIPFVEGMPEWKDTAEKGYMNFIGSELRMKENKSGVKQRLWKFSEIDSD